VTLTSNQWVQCCLGRRLFFFFWRLRRGEAELFNKQPNRRLGEDEDEISAKARLVGSYAVIGTDVDGTSYSGSHTLDISLAPSGALELDWDNGKQVGVGQVIGDVLAVACLSKGRTMILTMNINPDGSLSGKWSRRTDRGTQGNRNVDKDLALSCDL
jgi:hypothetical protein